MSNPVWFLLGVILATAYPTGSEPLRFAGNPWAAPAAWAAALALLGGVSALFYRRVESPRTFRIGRLVLKTSALATFGVLVFLFHHPLFVWEKLRVEAVPLAADLAVLLPFLSLMGIHGWCASGAETRLRGAGAASGIRSFAWRTFLGFSLFPVLVMVGLQSLVFSSTAVLKLASIYPFAGWILALGLIAAALAAAPLYLRLVFRARPLPAGPARERLEALARRAGFRCREILVLGTGGARVANAFIVGLHERLRYVFFTDAIVEGMSESELECVMAHEMSHGLRRHLLHYLLFSVAFLVLVLFVLEFLSSAPGLVTAAVTFCGAFAFWVVIFGFVSRRFETEADLVGMRAADAGGAQEPLARSRRFAAALYRVADLNHVPPDAGSWRHFSIARRAAILLEAEVRPESGRAWIRACEALRTAVWTALLFSVLYGAVLVRNQIARVPEARRNWERVEMASEGWRRLQAGRAAEAVPLLEESARHPHASGELWLVLSEAYAKAGRGDDAAAARRKAAEIGVADPRARMRLLRAP